MSVRAAQALYHRLIPATIRNPIGRFRRGVGDRVRRARAPYPLPPARLLRNVQLTPYVKEYLEVGGRSAATIIRTLGHPTRVLDFGCGSGRTLRHLRSTGWELFGCDIDADAIAWSRQALPFASFEVNAADPPLPYADGFFDAVFTISVFTHFPPAQQNAWAAEMARVLRDDGTLVVSSVGFTALRAFADTPANLAALTADGMLFIPGDRGFNTSGMFHSAAGIERLFSPHFRIVSHTERGLDGFQDLTVLERGQERRRRSGD
jgi:SAM-dependent methyltransferase